MKKNTILVLGANAGQLDLIKYMKSIDWNVVVCSFRKGEIGEYYADSFYLVDIRNIEEVTKLAIKINANLVYSVSSDTAITTAIKVSEKLSLPHFFNSKLINLFNNKHDLREYLNSNNLGTVSFNKISEGLEEISWYEFPCIVKPADAQGQRGVQKVESKENLLNAVETAKDISLSKTAIIEEYLDGAEISCNVLVNKGKVIFDILSERVAYSGEYMGIPKAHLIPCINVSKEKQEETLLLVHKIIKSLRIENGSLYFQMKVTSKGVKVIEIAPRLDGCHMWRLILNATDYNYLEHTVETLLGKCSLSHKVKLKDNRLYELVFQHAKSGKKFIKKEYPIPENVYYHEYRYNNGDEIIPINGRLEVVGYYTKNYQLENRPEYIEYLKKGLDV